MTVLAFILVLASLISVALFWVFPISFAQTAVAVFSLGFLTLLSPVSALWLLASTLLTPAIMRIGEKSGYRGAAVLIWAGILSAALLASREIVLFQMYWIGAAYFTLRHIHVLMDWWLGRVSIPGFPAYFRYQFFLPVLIAGPIHRLQNFERQCERRRWSAQEFFSGAERVLFGTAQVVILGDYGFGKIRFFLSAHLGEFETFMQKWMISAIDWLQLYVTFSALTGIALGLSLMCGLRLEENFNGPWKARNLIDFWSRWHMTLSNWCRDYVFTPVTAMTRSPLVGVAAAMLVLGVWHQTSMYYIYWAVWQSIGIVLTRVYQKSGDPMSIQKIPSGFLQILGPLSVLAWLSLARPVIETLSGVQ